MIFWRTSKIRETKPGQGSGLHPRCAFPIKPSKQVAVDILVWIQEKKPASLIRLGDGEGMVLSRPTPEDRDLWAHAQKHFGADVTVQYIDILANSLESAIKDADYVGIRDDMVGVNFPPKKLNLSNKRLLKAVKRSFLLRRAEKNLSFSNALRLAHTHRVLSQFVFNRDTRFCSAWVHFMLSSDNTLLKILSTVPRIGLVSSKRQLADELQNSLGKKVDYYAVQDMLAFNLNPNSSSDCDLDSFASVADSLRVRYPGQVFLVGAGVWGKIYCHQIKKLGGIAIDIGSVCDSWVGVPSRKVVYQSLFQTTDDNVPAKLLLANQLGMLNTND